VFFLLLTALTAAPVTAPPVAPERPIKPLPTLAKEPKLDGNLKDLAPAQDFKMPATALSASSALSLKAAFRKDSLFLGVKITDDKVTPGDELTVSLFFPGSGTTAKGHAFRFGSEGVRPPDPALEIPMYALEALKSGVKDEAKGFTLEIQVPVKALPRFQARSQLAVDICLEYTDDDGEGQKQTLSSCTSGEMPGGPTRLPDELRRVVKVQPPADVEGLEARSNGFVGYAELHYPTWGYTDEPLTAQALRTLIAGDDSIDPAKARLPISDALVLPDNRPLYAVLTGKDPYVGDKCDAEQEVRLAMYGVKGNVAMRVLEWPAITCGLGRALSFQLSPEGHLQIGYSNGSVASFTFSGDHFERSELGER
jgi:hypothetical protein